MNSDTSAAKRKLNEAFATVEAVDLPVNQIVMIEIRKALADGSLSTEELFRLLHSDPCLFTYCLQAVLADEEQARYPNHPLRLLEDAGAAGLEPYLDGPQFSLRTYSRQTAREVQSTVMTQLLAVSTAAEILALELQVDPEMAYASSVLTHFDLLLIAWHFPETLEKAVQTSITRRYSLRDAFIQVAGYASEELALMKLQSMKLGEDLLQFVSLTTSIVASVSMDQSDTMQVVLDLAKKFGQSYNPTLYPNGETTWKAAFSELVNGLGTEAAERVVRRIRRRLQIYTYTGFVDVNEEDLAHHGLFLAEKNPYLDKCPDILKQEFLSCYEQIESREAAHSALEYLLKHLLPMLDFKNGAIFALNEADNTLAPKYQIGAKGLENFPSYALDD